MRKPPQPTAPTHEQVLDAAACVIATMQHACPPDLKPSLNPILESFADIVNGKYGYPDSYDRCEDALLTYHEWQMTHRVFMPHHSAAKEYFHSGEWPASAVATRPE